MIKRERFLGFCRNKRGQFIQMAVFIVIFLVLGFIFVASNLAGNKINTMIQADSTMSSEAKSVMQANVDSQPFVFDSGAALVVIIVWLVCLGLAYNAASNPFMFVAAIFMILALGFAGMVMSNTWDAFYNDSGINSSASQFTMTNFLLQHYLIVILVMGFSTLMVFLYRQGSGG